MATLQTLVSKKIKCKLPSKSIRADLENAKSPVSSGCNKRKLEEGLEDQMGKRRKMDPSVKQQCCCIVDVLLAHPRGFVFASPVDPVALKIPDYFSIISHPMDLGTIRSKLDQNIYFTADEFAADVRLTFWNAMLYNPPDNYVHHMAKELECVFLKRWKLLEAKWKRESSSGRQGIIVNGVKKNDVDTGKNCSEGSVPATVAISVEDVGKRKTFYKKSHANSGSVAKESMSIAEKRKLKEDLTGILVGKMTEKLQSGLKKLGLEFSKKDIVDLDFNGFDDGVLRKVLEDCTAKDRRGEISSPNGSRPDLGSLGSANGLHEESTCCPCPVVTPAISDEVWNTKMDEQDLKKALRAAMLKKRFAETISKAASDKVDPKRVHQEAERLQQQEEAKIKALMRDKQLQKEMQREKEREAARIALDMVVRTVEHEDNRIILKEFERLSRCVLSYVLGAGLVLRDSKTGKVLKPLEQLGLRMKEDFMANLDEDIVLSWEGEEGEIVC